jgi:hypothetical protein
MTYLNQGYYSGINRPSFSDQRFMARGTRELRIFKAPFEFFLRMVRYSPLELDGINQFFKDLDFSRFPDIFLGYIVQVLHDLLESVSSSLSLFSDNLKIILSSGAWKNGEPSVFHINALCLYDSVCAALQTFSKQDDCGWARLL